MLTLVAGMGKGIGQLIALLLLILAVIWGGPKLLDQYKEYQKLGNDSGQLTAGLERLPSHWSELKRKSEQYVSSLKTATFVEIDRRIAYLKEQEDAKKKKQKDLEDGGVLTKFNPMTHIELARLRLEIDVASQERNYLQALKNQQYQLKICEEIHKRHEVEYRDYLAVKSKLDAYGLTVPFTAARKEKVTLKEQLVSLGKKTLVSQGDYDRCMKSVQAAKVKDFVVSSHIFDQIQQEIKGRIDTNEGETGARWLREIEQLLPEALGILVAAKLVPYLIKLCLYFVLAPIASRKSPICLVPEARPRSDGKFVVNTSAVSISVEVPSGFELVVKPAFFHSAPSNCRTSSRYVLNGRFLMTSLSAGMYNLTQVNAQELFVATISAGQEGLDELLQVEIAEGEAICLRPSNLVGLIQRQGFPVRISSHWRLGSLQAWLTMQLRYLVFHGPVTIVVNGCRGARMESAAGDKAIEQASTLGFSANLSYATVRAETAMVYLTGKKGLLRDRFSGQSGFFIFEEMPDPSKRAGMSGKRLEGVTDAVLKLFGV